jgi:hypothetical protein
MLVRVKDTLVENFYGFYGQERRYPGDEFMLKAVKDDKGKIIHSAESQFSSKWMEKVSVPRKPGPKPKTEEILSEELT